MLWWISTMQRFSCTSRPLFHCYCFHLLGSPFPQVGKDVCRFSHPGMGIHTLHELSWLKGEDEATVLSTIRNNTTLLYGI